VYETFREAAFASAAQLNCELERECVQSHLKPSSARSGVN
jgi:hypothetical protein